MENICRTLVTRAVIARIHDIVGFWVDDAGEDTTFVAIWAIPTHATGPNAVKTAMTAAVIIAQ